MKEIIFGTTNPAKLEQMRGALAPTGITVTGITEIVDAGTLPDVPENGNSACENARAKAHAYARAINRPVLSVDNALYLNGLPDNEQPGVHMRRMKGHAGRLTDQELLEHFIPLIESLGDGVIGRWEYGVCVATHTGGIAVTTIVSPRRLISVPSPVRLPGYPLESLQIDPESGTYVSEMTPGERAAFWQRQIGDELAKFIASLPDVF